MEYDKFFRRLSDGHQFDPISMGDSSTERRYGIFGNPFFNTMISTMGEHRVKKWTDLSFPRQSRPDQIKSKNNIRNTIIPVISKRIKEPPREQYD